MYSSLPSGQASSILPNSMLLCTFDRKRIELAKGYEQKLARLTASASLAEQLKLYERAAMWAAVEDVNKKVEYNTAQQVTLYARGCKWCVSSVVCEIHHCSYKPCSLE